MPRTIANFKCLDCGDVFTAKSDKYYECKCGASKVCPSPYSTSYGGKDGKRFERLKDGNDHTYYDQRDIFVLSGEMLEQYESIKSLSEKLDFSVSEEFEYDEDGNEYLKAVDISKYEMSKGGHFESNEINLRLYLDRQGLETEQKVKVEERLNNIESLLKLFDEKQIDISDRKTLLSDELNLNWSRTPVEHYDYEFYI